MRIVDGVLSGGLSAPGRGGQTGQDDDPTPAPADELLADLTVIHPVEPLEVPAPPDPAATRGADAVGSDVASAAEEPPPTLAIRDLADWWFVAGLGVLGAAVGLWIRSLSDAHAWTMNELGVISVLPPTFFVAIALLTFGFLTMTLKRSPRRSLLAGYLLALVAIVHATPAIVARTLGNAWAWANVGVVDAIQRTGDLPESTGALAAPTEWPGAVAFTAMAAEVSGVDPATIGMWLPTATSVVALLALWTVFRALTSDDRIVWTALWLYVLGNWVGQEHLSPIGFGLVLALALIAIALPFDRIGGDDAPIGRNLGPSEETPRTLAATVAVVALLAVALVASHPATALVAAGVFAVAALTRASRTWWVAGALVVLSAVWFIGPARGVVLDDPLSVLEPDGSPAQFATQTTSGLSNLTTNAQIVLVAGRYVAQAMIVLALIGIGLRLFRRRPVGLLAGLAAAPVVLYLVSPGGESALRAYLFALPWLAFAAALALSELTPSERPTGGWVAKAVLIVGLTVPFVLAQSGERGAGWFTSEEVSIATWLSDSAPAGTLLVEGSSNHPGVTTNVERFTTVPVAELVDADGSVSVDELRSRLATPGQAAAFVVLTRSQQQGETIAPRLPDGELERLEATLRAAPDFRIVGESRDAVVFTLEAGATS